MTEQPRSQMAVYSARPTVRVDTQEYPLVSELIIGMKVTEQDGGMSSLELRLSNVASDTQDAADLAFEDDSILQLGARIAIYSGDENAPQEIFRGMITGIEAEFPEEEPPELLVLAEDLLQQARMERRTCVHEDMSISDLASIVAASLNLSPVVTGFSERIGTQVQLNESDLAFLRRVLIRYDGDVQVVGDELHVSPRNEVHRGTQTLELHSQLRKARVLADLAHQVTELTVSGWNPIDGIRVVGSSAGENLGPGSGKIGGQILRDVLVERKHHVSHLAVTTTEEAQALAETAFDSRARRFVCVEGTAEGNSALRVGTFVTLLGMGPRFDNTYYVVKACHHWDVEQGYETDFEARCAYWGGN